MSDAPSGVDRLGCTIYAKAIAATAREAESPSTSLCVGLYARWGGGKSFLWTLIQRTLLASALVDTINKLHAQATDKIHPGYASGAAAALKKAVARLRDPKAKESAMVDEDQKLDFETQLKALEQTEPEGTTYSETGVGSLSQALQTLVGFLVSITGGLQEGYASLPDHEPDSFLGQQQQRRQQSSEAKAAENHAVAVMLVLVLVLLLLPFLLPLWLLWLLWLLLERVCGCPCSTKVACSGLGRQCRRERSAHSQRVLALLLEGGSIGLGEVEDSQISLATTLRYAVLRMAQLAASCFASAVTLSACFYAPGGEGELPEGATKYLVVEFNAWVYSGVRCRLRVKPSPRSWADPPLSPKLHTYLPTYEPTRTCHL